MNTTAALLGAAAGSGIVIALGLVLVGLGQVFEALKEIALNTRAMAYGANPAAAPRTAYAGLGFIALAMIITGGAFVVLGFAALIGIGVKA